VLSNHLIVSWFRTVRPCSPRGGRWIRHSRTTWSKVCSSAPHSQAAEGAIPHLCKQEGNVPTPVRRRLSRWTHAVLGRVIPGGWVPVSGMKVRSLVVLSNHSAFHRWSAQSTALLMLLMLSGKLMICCSADTNGSLDLRRRASALDGRVSAEWSRCPSSMVRRPRDSVSPLRRSSAGLDACEDSKVVRWCRTQAFSHNSQGVVDGSVSEAGVSTAAPGRSAVFCCWVDQDYKMAVRNVVALAPQPEPASRLEVRRVMSTFCEVTQGVGNTWATYPMLLRDIWARSRRAGFRCCVLTFSSRLASLLLKWKTADTAFVVLSFSSQIWRNSPTYYCCVFAQHPFHCLLVSISMHDC